MDKEKVRVSEIVKLSVLPRAVLFLAASGAKEVIKQGGVAKPTDLMGKILYKKRARNLGFLSLSPLGCLPTLRAQNQEAGNGGYFEAASGLALAHNNALSSILTSLDHILKGFKYFHSNFYDWLQDRIKTLQIMTNSILIFVEGFKEGINACCGIGRYEGIFTCGGTKKVKEYDLCDNSGEYVWWDSFHPT
ncbi:GDSL esterase/lipase 5-like [Lotus japonicus]|uniref:GDSL esterase/lipase 5-like n=1 Tax=Lotus japonicus TaxID=34305 RepID=UPI002589B443|nr:GDSL esterase/lipase 5-like [Lotus japonicus]